MKGPLKNARKFDEKQAYNKNLTASARLHYLENERHDAPGKMAALEAFVRRVPQ